MTIAACNAYLQRQLIKANGHGHEPVHAQRGSDDGGLGLNGTLLIKTRSVALLHLSGPSTARISAGLRRLIEI
jgi:hypothetical protein